jgi:hypothetical protein
LHASSTATCAPSSGGKRTTACPSTAIGVLIADRDADLQVHGRERPDVASYGAVLADLNGDGFDDLFVGSTASTNQPASMQLEPNVLYLPGVLVAKVGSEGLPTTTRSSRQRPPGGRRADAQRIAGGPIRTARSICSPTSNTRGMRVTLATTGVWLTARTRSGPLLGGHDSVTVLAGTADQLSAAGQADGAEPPARRR